MLSKVKLQNFKCIENTEIEFAPLTVFLGENGTGKSSVIEALSFLKQGRGRNVNNAYNQELVKLGGFKDMVYKGEEERWCSIRMNVKPSEEEIRILRDSDLPPECTVEGYTELGYELSIRGLEEIKHKVITEGKTLIEVGKLREKGKLKDKVLQPQGNLRCSVSKELPAQGRQPVQLSRIEGQGKSSSYAQEFFRAFFELITERLEDIYYISAVRGDLPRTGKFSRDTPFSQLKSRGEKEWVGVHGEYTLDLLSTIYKVAKPRRELKDKRDKIIYWAKEFGMSEIEAGLTGETDATGAQISYTFVDPKLGVILNPASSGCGSKQLLPVITQIFHSDPESTIMIEEPETSFHIKAQRKLLEMFAEAVKERKQIILTTHSEHIPLALRTVIPSGKINSEDVAIYHFERDKQTGEAKAQRLPLSSKGEIKNWIPSYIEAEKGVIEEWMNNVPEG